VYNIREGWRPEDDWLPDRLLNEPLTLPSGRVAALTADRLRAMIDAYYLMRGLDPEGRPDPAALADLYLIA
jgi:aldehyde:ferredoxin oxidoreductase